MLYALNNVYMSTLFWLQPLCIS